MNKRKFGIIGEKIAQHYLKNEGYEIIETNFFTKRGEIDIIAKMKNCLIFIEVKTRTSLNYGTPAEAVNSLKKRNIKKVANIYLYINKIQSIEIRFDVVEILINNGKCKINHIKSIM